MIKWFSDKILFDFYFCVGSLMALRLLIAVNKVLKQLY